MPAHMIGKAVVNIHLLPLAAWRDILQQIVNHRLVVQYAMNVCAHHITLHHVAAGILCPYAIHHASALALMNLIATA